MCKFKFLKDLFSIINVYLLIMPYNSLQNFNC